MRFPDPKRYKFSDGDLGKFENRTWQCPDRLVDPPDTDAPGLWAVLWRENGTQRGGGSVTSLLPVLAVHTFPGMTSDALAYLCNQARVPIPVESRPAEGWTPWACYGHRQLAALSGLDKNTVGRAIDRLVRAGLAQTTNAPIQPGEARPRQCYRLSTTLYRIPGESFTEFGGRLFYGGQWAVLPTNSARHLYVVLACVDPIKNEDAWIAGGYDVDEDDSAKRARDLARKREFHRLSITDIGRLMGVPESTALQARDILTTPYHKEHPTFDREKRNGNVPTWYARNTTVRGVRWFPKYLNDKAEVARVRREHWREFYAARDAAKRKAKGRAKKKARATELQVPRLALAS